MAKVERTEWAAIVAEAELGRLPQGEVAKKHGVSVPALKYHLYKSRSNGARVSKGPQILPIQVRDREQGVEAHIGALRVVFPVGTAAEYVGAVLSALGKC